MVRLSDILKKVQQKQEPSSPKEEIKPVAGRPTTEEIKATKPVSESLKPEQFHIAQAIKEAVLNREEAEQLYLKAIDIGKALLNKLTKGENIDIAEIDNLVRIIVDQLVLGNRELLALTSRNCPENYLYAHFINVTILAIEVGLGSGYNKSKLNELGLVSFLHDVGMSKVLDLALSPKILDEEELNKIREHPKLGQDLAKSIRGATEAVLKVIEQEHERINGKGYPNSLVNGDIEEFAQIIGMVDVYEALTHDRPYRKAYFPQDSIKEIFAACGMGAFDMKSIKVLVHKLGIYPLGSWVELNSGEFGKVTSSNEDFPLRPVVNILFDSEKHKTKVMKTVDLSKQHSLFIKRSLTEDELKGRAE